MIGDDISLLAAFAAGFLSFISPCVLPVVPVYIAILAGSGGGAQEADRRFVVNTACFMIGFIVVFVLMGATASVFGQLFSDHRELVRQAGAVFMVFMGLMLAGIISLSPLSRDWRPRMEGNIKSPFNAVLLGMAITAGWTPCVGPILASVLTYAGIGSTMEKGVLLLLSYAAGFAVPFLLFAALCNRYLNRIRSWYRFLPAVQKGAGFLLVLTGILIYFDLMQKGLAIISELL